MSSSSDPPMQTSLPPIGARPSSMSNSILRACIRHLHTLQQRLALDKVLLGCNVPQEQAVSPMLRESLLLVSSPFYRDFAQLFIDGALSYLILHTTASLWYVLNVFTSSPPEAPWLT